MLINVFSMSSAVFDGFGKNSINLRNISTSKQYGVSLFESRLTGGCGRLNGSSKTVYQRVKVLSNGIQLQTKSSS